MPAKSGLWKRKTTTQGCHDKALQNEPCEGQIPKHIGKPYRHTVNQQPSMTSKLNTTELQTPDIKDPDNTICYKLKEHGCLQLYNQRYWKEDTLDNT